jgi:hypothetical protein
MSMVGVGRSIAGVGYGRCLVDGARWDPLLGQVHPPEAASFVCVCGRCLVWEVAGGHGAGGVVGNGNRVGR